MTHPLRAALIALIGGAAIRRSTPPESALACSCVAPEPERSIENAEFVFAATSRSETDVTGEQIEGMPPTFLTRYELEVDTVWKGSVGPNVTMIEPPSATCGVNFIVGERYLVFANELDPSHGSLFAGLCDGTMQIGPTGPPEATEWADALAEIGPGEPPVEDDETEDGAPNDGATDGAEDASDAPQSGRPIPGSVLIGGLLLVVLIAGVGLVALRGS